MLLKSIFSPLVSTGACLMKGYSPSLILTRNLMKTHKATAKRWRKNAHGYKRGIAGRNHGNCGWSKRSLKVLTGRKDASPSYIKHLKRLLPYH
ncbi:large ribosomal subunit protein bL35m [Monosporozyma unispora]